MSSTVFLSTATGEFGDLRRRLAAFVQRTKKIHVRHQDDNVERGVLTLRKLHEEVESSDVVLHAIGAATGAMPPAEQVEDLLAHLPDFHTKLPQIAELARQGSISYTQWEAWLAIYLGKRLCCYQIRNRLETTGEAGDAIKSLEAQREHVERLRERQIYAKPVANDEELYDEILLTLIQLGLLTESDAQYPIRLPYPPLGELFIGREDFIEEIRDRVRRAREQNQWPNQAIHGLGGVGKTRLAVEYAWRYRDEYTAVLMINAESPASLDRELANLAGVLVANIDPATPDPQKLQATLGWLARNPGWLLLLDNVDTEQARNAVAQHLSALAQGHVLITSRIASWPPDIEPLDLRVLAVEDAERFMLQATDGHRQPADDDQEQASQLVLDELDCLCLALEQAAAYIRERNISLAEYRLRWQANAKNVRTWADKLLMRYHEESPVSLSIATTWQTTFDQLSAPARTLLEMLSWLAPDPLPRGLLDHPEMENQLQSASGDAAANIELAQAELRRYSLLSRPANTQSDSAGAVHGLVQLITRDQLPADQQQTTLEAILAAVNPYTPTESDDVRTWSVLEPLMPHLTILVGHADQAEIAEPTARLINEMGIMLHTKALFAEAEPRMRRALAIDEQSYGAEHPKVAIRLNNLAMLLKATNRLAEAEPLMRRALAIVEKSYGVNHPYVANCLHNLAALLQATNRLAEAEPLMRRALAIREQSYGPEHPDVAQSLNNLATLLQHTNRLAEAQPLMARVVTVFEKSYGESHPNVAVALNNLAQLLQDTNRLAEAEPLMRRAVEIWRASLGDEHPSTQGGEQNLQILLAEMEEGEDEE